MQKYHSAQKDVNASDASAGRSKDKGFQKRRAEQKKEEKKVVEDFEFYGAGRTSPDITENDLGTTHRDHADKKADTFVGKSKTNYAGRMFAVSGHTQNSVKKRIESLNFDKDREVVEYFDYLGVSGAERLFSETLEEQGKKLYSRDDAITNEAILMDNYEYFLNNTGYIKTNLAKTLLAKIDLDRDLRGTLADLLDVNGQWNNKDADVVYNELKNRLRNSGLEHHKEYEVIFKLFRELEKVERQHQSYKSERQKSVLHILQTLEDSVLDDLISGKDKVKKAETIRVLDESLRGGEALNLSPRNDESLLSYLNRQTGEYQNTNKPVPDSLLKAIDIVRFDDKLDRVSALDYKKKHDEYISSKASFVSLHNSSLSTSTEIIDRFGFISSQYPVSALARWADEEYLVENFSDKKYENGKLLEKRIDPKKMTEDMKKAITDVMEDISEEDARKIIERFRQNILKNKSKIESIYNTDKDTLNPQRKYLPFESQNYHEMANNVLRDSMYLSVFKNKNSELFDRYFEGKDQKEVVTSSLSSKLKELRPNVDEVNDLHNIISAINKTAAGTMSDSSFDALLDSPIMQRNSMLDQEDITSVRKYAKELGNTAERLRENDIYGLPEEREIFDSIQEAVYIEAANKEIDNLYGGGNPIGKYFFQNNKALRDLEICMEGARNPTTHVETTPSLAKSCFEKLKGEYEQAERETNQLISSPQAAFMGTTFVGAIAIFATVHSGAKKDMVDRLIAKINHTTMEEISYVENSTDALQKSARKFNVELDQHGFSGQMVEEGYADKLINEAELEHTIRDMVENTDGNTPEEVRLDFYDKAKVEGMLSAIYDKNSELETNKKAIIGDRLNRNKEELEKLKEKILENVEQKEALGAHLVSDTIREEFLNVKSEISKITESLNSTETLSDKELRANYANALSFQKEKLNDIKEKVFSEAMVAPIPEGSSHDDDVKKVKKIQGLIASDKKELEKMSQKRKADNIKNRMDERLKYDDKTKGVYFSLKDLHSEERNAIIQVLGKMRDDMNQMNVEKKISNESLDKEELKQISFFEKEIDRITKILPYLHRDALSDKENISRVLGDHIEENFHFRLSDDTLLSIREHGISDSIGLIMKEAESMKHSGQHLSSHRKNKLYADLTTMKNAEEALNSEGKIAVEAGSSILTSHLEIFQNGKGKMGRILNDSNNLYISSTLTRDGKSYVSGASGALGMCLYLSDKAAKEKDWERHSKLEALSAKIGGKGRATLADKEHVAIGLTKKGVPLSEGNTRLMQQTDQKNRQYQPSKSMKI